jgi:hypothetical protein
MPSGTLKDMKGVQKELREKVVMAPIADLGATVGVDVADAGPAQVALKTELDTTNTKVNAILAALRTAGLLES